MYRARAGRRILLGLILLVTPACGATAPADATEVPRSSATHAPLTVPPTAPPSAASDEGLFGPITPGQAALMELMPAELDGVTGFVTPGGGIGDAMEAALAELGLDPEDADVAWATYETADGLRGALMAFSVPGLDDFDRLESVLEDISREAGTPVQTTEMGGKTILGMSDTGGVYFADGTVFVFAAASEELAQELLGKLP